MDEKNTNFENQNTEEAAETNEPNDSVKQDEVSVTEKAEEQNAPVSAQPETEIPAPTVVYRWDYNEQARVDRSRSSKRKNSGKALYAAILASIFLLTVFLLVGAMFLGSFVNSRKDDDAYASLSDLYDACLPSYVAISTVTSSGEGTGSGIILTSDGYIATNYHVVENAKTIRAITSDGQSYDAEFINGDELNDVAVLKVEAHNLKAAKIGTSENSRVGDQVIAIGTPHSIDYQGTMTSGYISALNRRFVEQNENGTVKKVLYLIQTDTSVNPGNSGGPLFNRNGEVIGIVTLKIAGANYEGLGFAIPMESVMPLINDIMRNGEITDPDAGGANHGAALGVSGFDAVKDTKYLLSGSYHFEVVFDEELGEDCLLYPSIYGDIKLPIRDEAVLAEYNITEYTFFTAEHTGVVVISTTENFDSAKKLKLYDIILTADGLPCTQTTTLRALVSTKKIGEEIKLEIFRDGEIRTVNVKLGASADMTD
ncbi:MAG: trypsin-like serine protease [Ruminococcaceae bacterium]|nr:trypsin-like serine protease [Oscillospiraceae bacterium]